MKECTGAIIQAAINADETISEDAAKAAFYALTANQDESTQMDRVLSRKEVAALMGKSLKAVDGYGKSGVIRRIYLTGGGTQRVQAQGYSRNSVLEAMRRGKPTKKESAK